MRLKIPSHVKVVASSWISKLVIAFIQLFNTRYLLQFLGVDQYAIFSIIISLAGWFLLLDFGLGPSLQNYISELRSKDKDYSQYINQTFLLSFLLVVILVLLAYSSSNLILNALVGKFDLQYTPKRMDFFCLEVIWILNTHFSISYRVYYGQERGYWANIYPAIGYVISFISLITINRFYTGNRPFFWAFTCTSLPLALLSLLSLLRLLKLYPVSFSFKPAIIKLLSKRALQFFGFSLLSAFTLQIDYFVMSQTVHANSIVGYNIISKYFQLCFFICTAYISAVWPLSTKYMAIKDYKKVKGILRNILLLGFFIIILGSLGLFFYKDIIVSIFTKEQIVVPNMLIILMCLYFLLRVWSDAFAMVYMSVSDLRIFWIYVPIQSIISISMQYTLSLRFGINGIILGLIISFLFTSVWLLPYHLKKSTIQGGL